MIKGGFQGLDISGVDLTAETPTLPGAYEACEAAGGKPVRVLTAKGQVTCSIEMYSSNYLLAGVTGDGKILSIVVDGNDAIQVSETEIPSGGGGGGGSSENVALKDFVDLSAYSEAQPFTAPNDGILRVSTTGIINSDTGVEAKIPTGWAILIKFITNTNDNHFNSVFIRKGSIIAPYGDTIRAAFRYYEYEPIQS